MAQRDRHRGMLLLIIAKAEDQARQKISKTAVPMTPQLKKVVNQAGRKYRASRYEN